MKKTIRIGSKEIGKGKPSFVTAEIGLNHNGDPELAKKMISEAASAGVDAVKFQIFHADSFISKNIAKSKHQTKSLDEDTEVYQMWQRLELSYDDLISLKNYAESLGVIFYASAFDYASVDLLAGLNVGLYKIASGEITNLPLIKRMAILQKPMMISVGMASLGEIEDSINTILQTGNDKIVLLHCVANYPTEYSNVNLQRINTLENIFHLPVGFSDHTVSLWPSIAAVTLGAVCIEKHFTLDKTLPGTDHLISADPVEMKALIEGIRVCEASFGSDKFELLSTEIEGRTLFRRGMVAIRNLKQGSILTPEMITFKRPATGVEPKYLELIIGKKINRDISDGEPITWQDF